MTDKRKPLECRSVLHFPGLECTIESFVGKGSNSLVYLGSYPDNQTYKRHTVLIKELFPYDKENRILRNSDGSITVEPYAGNCYDLHKKSFLNAINIHLSLVEQTPQYIEGNINNYQYNGTYYSVLEYSGGRTLADELSESKDDKNLLILHTERMLKIVSVLKCFHSRGLLHLDISPDNILLIGKENERISIIDYNSVSGVEEIISGNNTYYSTKEGFTAPEILSGRILEICNAADVFSLTAVFYYCITGKQLSELQILSGFGINISEAECLKKLPDSVISMVIRILKKGLAYSVQRRYHSLAEIETDLKELIDRIQGRGITQWALWESSKKRIDIVLKSNPALSYLKNDRTYPIKLSNDNDGTVSPEEFCNVINRSDRPIFISGIGGIGKTTVMLKLAMLQSAKYDENSTAYCYISLYGWNDPKENSIKNKILEGLHFNSNTQSFEDARHELMLLLQTPVTSRSGTKPRLVILLDGWNEIICDTTNIVAEITKLSELEGVKLIISGRTVVNSFDKSVFNVDFLSYDEVRSVLSLHGILPPENVNVLNLLRTPMMLSLFINTAENNGSQIAVNSESDLLEKYFNTMCFADNCKNIGISTPLASVATRYVLAEIAKRENRQRQSLTEKELYSVTEKCYYNLKKHRLKNILSDLTGFYNEIFNGTADADAWFGAVVYGILWHDLGLIIKEENGRFRIFHQNVRDYLKKKADEIDSKLYRITAAIHFVRFIAAGFSLFLVAVLVSRILPSELRNNTESITDIISEATTTVKPLAKYKTEYAESVLQDVEKYYLLSAEQYEKMTECIELALFDDSTFDYKCDKYIKEFQNPSLTVSDSVDEDEKIGLLLASGDIMPWSGLPFAADDYKAFHKLVIERSELNASYLQALLRIKNDKEKWNNSGNEFCELLQTLIDADASVTGNYYQILLNPEISNMERVEQQSFLYMIKYYSNQYEISSSSDAVVYEGKANSARFDFNSKFGYLIK